MKIGSESDLAAEFGGTFVSPESGNRGDKVFASTAYIPEIAEEEERIFGRDPLKNRRFSARRARSPFTQIITEETQWGGQRKKEFQGDSAYWPMNATNVKLEDLDDPSDWFETEFDDGDVDEDGYPAMWVVDSLAGPRFLDPYKLSPSPSTTC